MWILILIVFIGDGTTRELPFAHAYGQERECLRVSVALNQRIDGPFLFECERGRGA